MRSSVDPGFKHETWSSRRAFLLAAIGNAVGLGNIRRSPYITGVNDGVCGQHFDQSVRMATHTPSRTTKEQCFLNHYMITYILGFIRKCVVKIQQGGYFPPATRDVAD
jgi:hypothetical protein